MADDFAIPSWMPTPVGIRHPLILDQTMPLIHVGGLNLLESALWLPMHQHDLWELHVVLRGRLDLVLADGKQIAVPGGWCCLTAPGVAHRGRDGLMPPAHLLWLQFNPLDDQATRGTPFTQSEMSELAQRLASFGDRSWPAPPSAFEALRRLQLALEATRTDTHWASATAAVRLALADTLLTVFAEAPPPPPPPALATALAALVADTRRPCTVATAARRAGLSPATLHALCAKHLGTTPASWLLNHRLMRARDQLLEGDSVTDVARRLGFSSPRYFAHAFRREVGVQPSLYAAVAQAARTEATRTW